MRLVYADDPRAEAEPQRNSARGRCRRLEHVSPVTDGPISSEVQTVTRFRHH